MAPYIKYGQLSSSKSSIKFFFKCSDKKCNKRKFKVLKFLPPTLTPAQKDRLAAKNLENQAVPGINYKDRTLEDKG